MSTGSVAADPLRGLVEAIVTGEDACALGILEASPQLAKTRAGEGAIRQSPTQYFFDQIRHYFYAGDSALHMAAAACQWRVVEKLIALGADISARNRRGAEPLHYAVDIGLDLPLWNAETQSRIIATLIRSGADPNALDKSGVAPLHRAIRNRNANAVRALIAGGADPQAPNGKGSTPLLLATHNTGKSGSGSAQAKAQQEEILCILAEYHAA